MKWIKPDFRKNILNISATLAEFLGCPNGNPVLPALARELKKDDKNVVFLILDGMGMHPIEKNLPPDSFLRRHLCDVLTSVFPSTTTCATTTILTNKPPMEHGWFGWSLYFEELKRAVDIFPERDSGTGEPIERGYVARALPIRPFYKDAHTDREIRLVVPPYWHQDDENLCIWDRFEELFGHIKELCSRPKKQFLYVYCDEPDATMHKFGVTSDEARRVIRQLNDELEALAASLPNTLWIVTADHGQVDVGDCIELYKDEELLSLLEWPPFLEPRAMAFKVGRGCRRTFCALFRKKYGADFKLCRVKDLIEENYFGAPAGEHARLLGDYIAIGIGDKIMKPTPRCHDFKGHHTSVTEEMEVPLILFRS